MRTNQRFSQSYVILVSNSITEFNPQKKSKQVYIRVKQKTYCRNDDLVVNFYDVKDASRILPRVRLIYLYLYIQSFWSLFVLVNCPR